MPRKLLLLATLGLAATAGASEPYRPYSGIERGHAGLRPLAFSASNSASGPIVCSVGLAHWYSVELGRADPGGAVRAELWRDPVTGVVALLNETAHRMPLEALWCGFEGRAWATRSQIDLPRASAPTELEFVCRDGVGRLECASPDAHR